MVTSLTILYGASRLSPQEGEIVKGWFILRKENQFVKSFLRKMGFRMTAVVSIITGLWQISFYDHGKGVMPAMPAAGMKFLIRHPGGGDN